MAALVIPTVAVLVVALVSGCGATTEEKHAYRNAATIKPIEMPPGLKMPGGQQPMEIPEQTETKLASVDELEKPPRIIESVDLKILDDNNDKNKSAAQNQSAPVNASSQDPGELTAEVNVAPPTMQLSKNDNGDSLLIVDGDFDKVWPLVKPALIELGFTIDDSSKGSEIYEISKELPTLNAFDKPVHPGDEKPEVKEEFQIHVKPADEKTQITVHNKLGQLEGSGLAEHLLLQIKQIMEKPAPATLDTTSDG